MTERERRNDTEEVADKWAGKKPVARGGSEIGGTPVLPLFPGPGKI